jgi:type I restriction enzyme M protein
LPGQQLANIHFGDSFTDDHLSGKTFDYMLANPPFGVEWRPDWDFIRKEYEEQGYGGRFGAGLLRINLK